MTRDGERRGQKILPLGAGELDLKLLKAIEASGYRGPIGILDHSVEHDAEARLQDNLDGLQWLVKQLRGEPFGPRPNYRTWQPPPPQPPADIDQLRKFVDAARREGSAQRGMTVFASQKFACLACHKIGRHGGEVGPVLSEIGTAREPWQLVEAVLHPQRHVEPQYQSTRLLTAAGTILTGYVEREDEQTLVLRDASNGQLRELPVEEIEARQRGGSVMPEGLLEAMRPSQRRDLFAFLMDLGRGEQLDPRLIDSVLKHWAASEPATFEYATAPLDPENWTELDQPVNRDRLFQFYTKQAEHFRQQEFPPPLLAEFPGLDGGGFGHWGNQNEAGWKDDRWNQVELGSVQCGVFRGGGVEVRRGVCLQLGEDRQLFACFDPETLSYRAVWKGDFLKFSDVRHGFMDGLMMAGELVPGTATPAVTEPFEYHGFYRHGDRVIFAYAIDGVEYLDSPWVEQGQFVRIRAPRDEHPLRDLLLGGPAQWPQQIETEIQFGPQRPYVVDTIEIPRENPWNALIFGAGLDFLPGGDAIVTTMQGDVWRVSGLDAQPNGEGAPAPRATWRRIAAGLQQALGVVAEEDAIYVLGRDRITKLQDLNGDGEMDLYQSFCDDYETSPGGHDFICGLQRDGDGYFYAASSNQGLLRISPDGRRAEVIATGFRNPDGVGVYADGTVTIPCSEGQWTPASMICARAPWQRGVPFFGYRGPRDGQPPELPLVYLPRGIDNSSGGQVYIDSDRWGPLAGNMVHLSFGAGTWMLLLRDQVGDQLQGAVVPMPGDFRSGVHRGRFRPQDGQLYVTGMAGWGSYTTDDGCLQRVRYCGGEVIRPIGFHVHANGVTVEFSAPLEPATARDASQHFAQCWNYRYSSTYGSPEYSARHWGVRGHDVLDIRSAHVLEDGRTLFLEMPDLQMVNQLHLRLYPREGVGRDLFATVNAMDEPYTNFPGYEPEPKEILPHPILADIARAVDSVPNPFREKLDGARPLEVLVGNNLSFQTRELRVRAGEPLQLTLVNPDAVPHNWALLRPGTIEQVGQLANALVGDPAGAARQYVPESDAVLTYTDVVEPKQKFTIYFRAPERAGAYPYICTFPGHWMVMQGTMIVEPAAE
jgi:putative heme-binding domain-containing protein